MFSNWTRDGMGSNPAGLMQADDCNAKTSLLNGGFEM
jgi:hypothetical protein